MSTAQGSTNTSSEGATRSREIQRRFEWPVIVAASLTIPILVIQESDLGGAWQTIGGVLNWLTWAVFLAEVVVMLWVVDRRWHWIRTHPVDVVVVLLTPPFAPAAWQAGRVFRLIRLLRLARLWSLRRLLSLEGMKYAALIAGGTVVLGGALFVGIEKGQQHLTTWDGIWWAMTTVTTVGYGDIRPESDAGRVLAMAIMLTGIGFVALLTAFIAERFVQQQKVAEAKEDQILAELREIRVRLDRLEAPAAGSREAKEP